jgi:hypothetical protein
MILQAIRIIDAALRDATIGLAAQIAALSIEAGDTRPTVPTIYNETQHGQAARDQAPDGTGPWLLIASGDMSERLPTVQPVRDGTVQILIRYVIRSQLTPQAVVSAAYTLDALRLTMASLCTTAAGNAVRSRGPIQVVDCTDLQAARLTAPVEADPVTWGMAFTVRCRDTRAIPT